MGNDECLVTWKEIAIHDDVHALTRGDDSLTCFAASLVIQLSHFVDPNTCRIDHACSLNSIGQTCFDILSQNAVDAIVRIMKQFNRTTVVNQHRAFLCGRAC